MDRGAWGYNPKVSQKSDTTEWLNNNKKMKSKWNFIFFSVRILSHLLSSSSISKITEVMHLHQNQWNNANKKKKT